MATIVVVDDEPALRDAMAELFVDEGHVVIRVADGAAARAAMHQAVPDLVVSDVMMPRLDGPGLVRWMRSQPQLRRVPVILASAVTAPALDDLTPVAFLTKPFELEVLLAVAARLLAHAA